MAFTNSHLRLSFREQEFFDLAMDAFDRGAFDKALAIVGQFLEQQPDNWSALDTAGRPLRHPTVGTAAGGLRPSCRIEPCPWPPTPNSAFRAIRSRNGQRDAATRSLAVYLGKPKGDSWETKVGKFLLDRLSEADFCAPQLVEPGDKVEHQCEAWFYAGMKRRLTGDIRRRALISASVWRPSGRTNRNTTSPPPIENVVVR